MTTTSSAIRGRAGIVIAAILFLGLPLLGGVATLVTDYWWFIDLGQRGVFITQLTSAAAVGAAFGLAAFVLLYVNMRIARTLAPRFVVASPGGLSPQLEELVSNLRLRVGPVVDRVILWGSLVVGVLVGLSMAPSWDIIRLAFSAQSFGVTDPQFGQDVGFYVFALPALRLLADWLPSFLVLVTAAAAFVHLVDGAIQPLARLRGFAPHVKAHLSVLVGLIVTSKAFDYYLSIFELNFSPRGQVTGASFTDVNAQLPALRILVVVSLAAAAALLINIRFKGWRLPLVALGVWVAAAVLLGGVYPALIQQFRVEPNELAAEEPYIERNIEGTRRAFDLEDVELRPFAAAETLSADDVLANTDTLDNVRLWDPDIVTQSYRQLQVIRQYYHFTDVDVDRYMIDGRQRQVLVSARELDVEQLDPQARTWVNQHLVYTHGYGFVMSPSNEADARGFPRFLIADIPPESSIEITVTQPAIYFGERTNGYVIVNTTLPEFDYPVGDTNAETFYEGAAGIKVGGFVKRAVFALRFGASQFLFSRYIEPDSRVLFDRTITARVEKLAPWLSIDDDPYPILSEGRILWVLDGYTSSDMYPYSQRYGNVNYVRNSVKVTIDAYDGTVKLYAFDPEDPILAAWSDIFPGLLTDASEIPADVGTHFRYPEDLFQLQAEVYKRYHMTDTRVFYNKEDLWEFPGEGKPEGPMKPFYVLSRLPGEENEDFQMIMPFTPRERDNMIGWMAAKSDPNDYGKRVVYQFPKQRVILGPDQVKARINQDDRISPQLSLWSQRGSQVIFGNMLVIPLEESIVYIQPLYLQAEQAAMPELVRVLVVYADKVEMAADLESALLAVFGEAAPARPDDGSGDGGVVEPEVDAASARELYDRAIEAQRQGDWSEYGRLLDELGGVLARLAGGSVESTITP
ncbi:MAG: UPF0182 family protein [Coriobacteriia bacterium]|nr:UPF0182 family protein [Coriobacteriia bacterium]